MTHRLKSQNHYDYYRKTVIESNTFLKCNQLILIFLHHLFLVKHPLFLPANVQVDFCAIEKLSFFPLLLSVAVNLPIWSEFQRATKFHSNKMSNATRINDYFVIGGGFYSGDPKNKLINHFSSTFFAESHS